jgi:Ca-activated chloride channel family protein
MVLDRSGSMGAEMRYGGERLTRLEAVKRVFREFLIGDDRALPGRSGDLVGMISFARSALTVCPLTLAHDALSKLLQTVQLPQQRSEDGTAMGDAIGLAVARLMTVEETLSKQTGEQPRYAIKSKIIVLLTDGRNNVGVLSPLDAAKLARDSGVKIYAVGVGEEEGLASHGGLLGGFFMQLGEGVDRATLEQVAEISGGRYFAANDAAALKSVYAEIDKMERSEIQSLRWFSYKELYPSFVLAALGLLAVEVLLRTTLLRTVP